MEKVLWWRFLEFGEEKLELRKLPRNRVWLDIETRKVVAPADWLYKKRWQTFLVGIARFVGEDLRLDLLMGEEAELIAGLEKLLREMGRSVEIVYCATRQFDEMVLKGRFTNARRALSPVAGDWPHLPQNLGKWINIRKQMKLANLPNRVPDLPSKDVPARWDAGERKLVGLHCARDVAELILVDLNYQLPEWMRLELEKLLKENEA